MLQGHIYWNLHQPCVYIVIYSIFVKKTMHVKTVSLLSYSWFIRYNTVDGGNMETWEKNNICEQVK